MVTRRMSQVVLIGACEGEEREMAGRPVDSYLLDESPFKESGAMSAIPAKNTESEVHDWTNIRVAR